MEPEVDNFNRPNSKNRNHKHLNFADEQQKNNAKSSRQTILETKMFKLKNQLINCKLIKRSMW